MKLFHRLFMLLLLWAAPLPAQHQWVHGVGGNNITDAGNAVGTDGAGNVYVTGVYNGQNIDFGNGVRVTSTLSTYSNDDIFLAKYNRNGTCIWVRSIPGAHTYGGVIGSTGISVDVFGNVFVCGEYDGTARNFGGIPVQKNSGGFVARFDSSGYAMWVNTMIDSARYGSPNAVQPRGITHDAAGNVYVTGQYNGSVIIGGRLVPGGNTTNVFVAKFGFGGQGIWVTTNTVRNHPIIFGAIGKHISWSPDNQIYVSGIYGGLTLEFAGGYNAPLDSFNIHTFTARFDATGRVNLLTYTSGFGAFYTSTAAASMLDPSDYSFYVTCYTTMGTNAVINFGNGFTVQHDPLYNGMYAFLIKKDYYGNTKWVRTMKTSFTAYLANVLTDAESNAYVCGAFGGAFPVNFGGTMYSPQGADLVVAKFTPQGNGSIVQAATGPVFIQPLGFALTDSAKPVVTGIYRGQQTFPPLAPINAPSTDMFVVKGMASIPPIPRDTAKLWIASRDVVRNDTAYIAFYQKPGEAGLVQAYEMQLTYDSTRLTIMDIDTLTLPGGPLNDWRRAIRVVKDTIKIAVYGASPILREWLLFKLKVYIHPTASGTTPLTFTRAIVNTGAVPLRTANAILTIRTTKAEERAPLASGQALDVFPNPFQEAAEVAYSVPESGSTVFTVYDLTGRKVHEEITGPQEPGMYRARLAPGNLGSGMYLLVMRTNRAVTAKKVFILK